MLADVDGDGALDAVVLHDGWTKLGVYRQGPGPGPLSSGEELYPFAWVQSRAPDGLAVGDLNGDGRPDIVAGDLQGIYVMYHR